ncbi:MAG: DNA primase [Bacteroidales bacterium]|jgi:DNA primase|nr:DNA primase [Bacteroidales bacterium]
MILQEDIAKIFDATQIVDVISAFVPLKKRGTNYIGCCPFHNEKTPSFVVSPSKGIFKCFGCGEAGNAAHFLMKHEHYSYPEALHYLANKYGISIQERELTEKDKLEQGKKEELFNINEFARKYFSNILLNDEQGKAIGLSYFKERDLSDETIEKWNLGYSKEGWQDFYLHAKKNGYDDEILKLSGLTIEKENSKEMYDRFRGRVIFPIYNIGGRTLGFTARILSSSGKTKAKYVNSPESDIFSKGKVLFGLNFAKNAILKEDLCYLVEGNMDAITLSQNSVENVVATSGTALTLDQINLIKRYTKNVTILYDGDSAGIKAAFRAVDLFVEGGLNVNIVLFPDGEDPDSYCRKLPQEEFKSYIKDKAENFILFKTHLLLEDAKDDPFKRSNLIKEILNTISLIADQIERAAYIQQCSSILNMKEEILNNALTKVLRERLLSKKKLEKTQESSLDSEEKQEYIPEISPKKSQKQILKDNFPDEQQERSIISLLLNYGDKETTQKVIQDDNTEKEEVFLVCSFLIGDILSDDIVFDNPLYQKVFDIYKEYILEKQTLPNLSVFTANEDEEIQNLSASLLMSNYKISDLWGEKWKISVPLPQNSNTINQNVKESLLSLKLNKLERKIYEINEKIKQEDNYEDQLILLAQIKTFKAIKKIISSELKRIITK